ncbi:hypothetical protein [Kitasatospora camelliae]|uniref:Alkaline shock family protein YloU n=1 Tax=Kitasatospora camelliae TaxID=3156397 RepID=A0AAU8K353_9ACTN
MAQAAYPVPAARRGRLRIADRVYAGIAARVAAQALAEAWRGRTERGRPPRASVLVARGAVRITLHLDLPFPADVRALARTTRDAVAQRVAELTGSAVREVSVVVDHLLAREPAG